MNLVGIGIPDLILDTFLLWKSWSFFFNPWSILDVCRKCLYSPYHAKLILLYAENDKQTDVTLLTAVNWNGTLVDNSEDCSICIYTHIHISQSHLFPWDMNKKMACLQVIIWGRNSKFILKNCAKKKNFRKNEINNEM